MTDNTDDMDENQLATLAAQLAKAGEVPFAALAWCGFQRLQRRGFLLVAVERVPETEEGDLMIKGACYSTLERNTLTFRSDSERTALGLEVSCYDPAKEFILAVSFSKLVARSATPWMNCLPDCPPPEAFAILRSRPEEFGGVCLDIISHQEP